MKRAPINLAKFLVFVAAAIVIIVAAALVLVRSDDGANSPAQPASTTAPTTTDRVKEDSGNTGDNQPSATGTDPDGNNTLMSQ